MKLTITNSAVADGDSHLFFNLETPGIHHAFEQIIQFATMEHEFFSKIKAEQGSYPAFSSKIRYGIFEHGKKDAEILVQLITTSFKGRPLELVGAVGEGDCFFDAVAQALNQAKNSEQHSVKSLRDLLTITRANFKNKVMAFRGQSSA